MALVPFLTTTSDSSINEAATLLVELQSFNRQMLYHSPSPSSSSSSRQLPVVLNDCNIMDREECYVQPQKLSKKRLNNNNNNNNNEDLKHPNKRQRRVIHQDVTPVPATSSNTTTAHHSQGHRRRVRFQSNNNNTSCQDDDEQVKVQAQVHTFDRVDQEDVPHVWWTAKEIGHIHRRERSMVSILTTLCRAYVEQLAKLVQISSSSSTTTFDSTTSSSSSATSSDAGDSDNRSNNSNSDEETTSTMTMAPPPHVWLADNQGRGLETEVAHMTGINSHCSARKVTRKVLQLQEQIREYNRKHCHHQNSDGDDDDNDNVILPEVASQLLSVQAQALSTPNIQFAQFLAVGDAQAAAAVASMIQK